MVCVVFLMESKALSVLGKCLITGLDSCLPGNFKPNVLTTPFPQGVSLFHGPWSLCC